MDIRDVVFLRRKQIELTNVQQCQFKHTQLVASVDANLRTLGYCFSEDLFHALECQDDFTIIEIHDWLMSCIKTLLGADHIYQPMYVDFPKQVMELSDLALYLNAIFHYRNRDLHHLGIPPLFPQISQGNQERLPECFELEGYEEIGLANPDVKFEILKNLLESSVAYSQTDQRHLSVFSQCMDITPYLPDHFVNRENIAYIMAIIMKKDFSKAKALEKYMRSATDILRLQVALCNGDVSLATPSKFKSLPRQYRRYLLSLYEQCQLLEEDFSSRKEYFKKAFQYLHVDEYKQYYPKTSEAINNIRDGIYTKNYYSKVEEAIKFGDCNQLIDLLSKQPGVFSRKLDEVLRKCEDSNMILDAFEKVADEVNVRILFTVREHFKHRNHHQDYRVFFPKGQVSKAQCITNNLDLIQDEIVLRIVNICDQALVSRLSKKEPMGKVYIDESLKEFKAPMVLRNLSKSSKTITRGSHLPYDITCPVLRGFIWWKSDCDMDLSMVFFDDEWKYINHVSYTNLKMDFACHSGDITYQRKISDGECEFIDAQLLKAHEQGVRYIVLEVHSFNHIEFKNAHCFVGYMERQEPFVYNELKDCSARYPNTGEVFEPKTVKYTLNLTQDAQTIIPWIFDVKHHQMIWADIAVGGSVAYQNVESTLDSSLATCYALINNHTPTLYDVLYFNALARGEIVDHMDEADECFTLEKTPYEIDRIVQNFISE